MSKVDLCLNCNIKIQQTRNVGLLKQYCSDKCYSAVFRSGKRRIQKKGIIIPSNPVDLSYMAGLIDCDGYITINVTRPSGNTRQKTDCYYSKIAVTNTNVALLQWISEKFGGWYGHVGGINIAQQREEKGWKPGYEWQTTGSDANAILRVIYPYLVIKNRQADLVFELEKTAVDIAFKRGEITPQWIVEERSELKSRINLLNKKGSK